jgi:hypothetical protein
MRRLFFPRCTLFSAVLALSPVFSSAAVIPCDWKKSTDGSAIHSLIWKEVGNSHFEDRFDFSTRATNVEAGIPRASLSRKSVSRVGDIRLFSNRLRKVRSTSASNANFSWVMPALSRAFLRTSPNMPGNSQPWLLDCLSLISYKVCWHPPENLVH